MMMMMLSVFIIIVGLILHGIRKILPSPPAISPPNRDLDSSAINSPLSKKPREFDVFLSFRGEDTRNGFTGHLHEALCQRGLSTFIDSKKLEKGEKIEKLFQYIDKSKVFVPIFSPGYADSKWCLKEIAKIVKCGRLIVPVFFNVEPSDIRHQTGPFKSAFQSYQNQEKANKKEVNDWRDALKMACSLSGYSLKNDANGHEPTLIKAVARRLSQELNRNLPTVVEGPQVGIESRVEDMMKLLQIGADGVRMVGIVGLGGIGKTTIARAVCNKLRSVFEEVCFVCNIREHWEHIDGRLTLLRQLNEDILKDNDSKINDVEYGKRLIKERIGSKEVLIILDDVNQVDQLETLAGASDWFMTNSRIIITTRDESVLLRHGIKKEHVYRPELLDTKQSLDLFTRHAFRTADQAKNMYPDLSKKIVTVTGGLPLALKVFGSHLSDKNGVDEWQEFLEKLEGIPDQEIQLRLRISYDALEEIQKQIFLDITCFFTGHSAQDATCLWKDSNWYPKLAIEALADRSLITISNDGQFGMHDLLRDMGRDIVRQGEYSKPWMWKRLWIREDLYRTLRRSKKNDVIEGIIFPGRMDVEERLTAKAFGKMWSLRLLRLYYATFFGEDFMLPEDLKFLYLYACKFDSLSSCDFESLVVLEIHVADELTKLLVRESSRQVFNSLKVLKIACHQIYTTPNFSNMPHLETLEFSYCAMLSEVHESIGSLRKLKHLEMLQCLSLEKLPNAICQLTSLETLLLKQFPRLSSLPDRLGNLESLHELGLENLAIADIPSSIGQLTKLRRLSLKSLERVRRLPDSIRTLDSLEELIIEGTDLEGIRINGIDLMDIDELEILSCDHVTVLPFSSLMKANALRLIDDTIEELPDAIEPMQNIKQLSLTCKNLKALPAWLLQWKNLKTFEVDCQYLNFIGEIWSLGGVESLSIQCPNLEELPAMAGRFVENLKSFALKCKNLKALPDWIGSLGRLESLKLDACENITELPSCISSLARLAELALNGCKRLQSLPRLPPSLLVFDASDCARLEKILDISNLKSLRKLCVGGCQLLQDVLGIENTAENLEELVLPGPYGSVECSSLTDDFKNKVFKEVTFERLRRFEISGSVMVPESVTAGQRQLSFMVPNRANDNKFALRIKRLVLNKAPSPIRISLVEEVGDHATFETTRDVQRPFIKKFFRPILIPLPGRDLSVFDRCIPSLVHTEFGDCEVNIRQKIRGIPPCGLWLEARPKAVPCSEDDPEIIEELLPPRVQRVWCSPLRDPYLEVFRLEHCTETSDYAVEFEEDDEIQGHLSGGGGAIMVSADTSNLSTISMSFSFGW